MEQLMVEVLEEVTARELLPQEAAAVMALAGEYLLVMAMLGCLPGCSC
jgi:hypothetical protein